MISTAIILVRVNMMPMTIDYMFHMNATRQNYLMHNHVYSFFQITLVILICSFEFCLYVAYLFLVLMHVLVVMMTMMKVISNHLTLHYYQPTICYFAFDECYCNTCSIYCCVLHLMITRIVAMLTSPLHFSVHIIIVD